MTEELYKLTHGIVEVVYHGKVLALSFDRSSRIQGMPDLLKQNKISSVVAIFVTILTPPCDINLSELVSSIRHQIKEIGILFATNEPHNNTIDLLREYNLNLDKFDNLKTISLYVRNINTLIDCKLLPQSVKDIGTDSDIYYTLDNITILDVSHLHRINVISHLQAKNFTGNTYLPKLPSEQINDHPKFKDPQLSCKCQMCLNASKDE